MKHLFAQYSKKGDQRKVNNYKGITLLNTGYNVILKRSERHAEEAVGEYQSGFRQE